MARTFRTHTQFKLQILIVHIGTVSTWIRFGTTVGPSLQCKQVGFFFKLFNCPHIPVLPGLTQDRKTK